LNNHSFAFSLRELLLRRPNHVREFAAAYFTHPDLPGAIKQKVIEEQKKK